MKRSQAILGFLLVLIGALLLLQKMDFLQGTWENVLWTVVAGAAGIYMLYLFIKARKRWWWIIFGSLLLGVMANQLLFLLVPQLGSELNDTILLSLLGLGFILVFFVNRTNWWAMVPGGFLVTLGLIALSENTDYLFVDSNVLLFFGLGITFFLLFLIPTPVGRLNWAAYFAIPLLLVGAYFAFMGEDLIMQLAGPILIIVLGLFFIINTIRTNISRPKPVAPSQEPDKPLESLFIDDSNLPE